MKVEKFIENIKVLGIDTLVGVPDSTLKQFCDYINANDDFKHYVPANEGAAVGIAMGAYLATHKPACVYMQNSGLGNVVNPFTSLAHKEVYDIPMLFVIGWRGEPGEKDEPQHRFMGKLTEPLLEALTIPYSVISAETSEDELRGIIKEAAEAFAECKQYAILVKKGTFESVVTEKKENGYTLLREKAIEIIIKKIDVTDVIVSTTGKISREVYEQSDMIVGHHQQSFLTVGGMGHAGMIALGIAQESSDKKVYCIEGDGAIFMHMGALAFIAKQQPQNLIHICLNNDAHESVGGMPTGAVGTEFWKIAETCGYRYASCVDNVEALEFELNQITNMQGPIFLEIKVKLESREDLGRPKESAVENKEKFVNYHFGI